MPFLSRRKASKDIYAPDSKVPLVHPLVHPLERRRSVQKEVASSVKTTDQVPTKKLPTIHATYDGRKVPRKRSSSINVAESVVNRGENHLTNPEINSRGENSASSTPQHQAGLSHCPTSFTQPKHQSLSASKSFTSSSSSLISSASPPEDPSHDKLPSLSVKPSLLQTSERTSAEYGNTRTAGYNDDSSTTAQTQPSRINPKAPQKGRRNSSIVAQSSSSTVPSLTSRTSIYPSFGPESVLSQSNPSDPLKPAMKFSRKSSNQDRHTGPRLQESKLDCGVDFSDPTNGNPHDYAQRSVGRWRDTDRLAQSKASTNRDILAPSKPPGTGNTELHSSDSSESSGSSSSSSISSSSFQLSPIRSSTRFINSHSNIHPSTAVVPNQRQSISADAVTSYSNIASFSDKYENTLPSLQRGKDKRSKPSTSSSSSSVNMLAVNNTSVRDVYPPSASPPSSSPLFSPMMPQFPNFQCYPANMMMPNGAGMSNPFVLAAMVDGSGRPFSWDLSVMQQHMLNQPHVFSSSVPSGSLHRKGTGNGSPYPSGSARHHSTNTKPANHPHSTGRSSVKNDAIIPPTVTPSRGIGGGGLPNQRQGQSHVPESKRSHVIGSSPHNLRHDKRSRAHPPVTFSHVHPAFNDSRTLSSSSDSLRLARIDNRRMSSSSSSSRHHRYSGSSSHHYSGNASITGNVSAKPVVAVRRSSFAPSSVVPVQSNEDSAPLKAANDVRRFIEDDKVALEAPPSEYGGPREEKDLIMKTGENRGSMAVDEVVASDEAEPEHEQEDIVKVDVDQRRSKPFSFYEDDGSLVSSGVGLELTSPVEEKIIEKGPPKYFPVTLFLSKPDLLASLLPHLSFRDWCMITSMSKTIRMMLTGNELLKEEVLEQFLWSTGYRRWAWRETEHISLTLRDLHDYMRCINVPISEYTRVAELYLKQQKVSRAKRDPDILESAVLLRDATRAYNRVVLRLREQAEKDPALFTSNSSIESSESRTELPAFRLRHAPLLRVFVPSPSGDWLSDSSVQLCESELKYAELTKLLRMGDVVWDIAVGDNGNFGRMIWDGKYLIDLDYTYSDLGDLPKYIPSLAFPPSYFHRVLRQSSKSSDPIVRIDISPWGEEIASNLQLLQNKNKGRKLPQATYHGTNWVHQSSFLIKAPRVQTPGKDQAGQPLKELSGIPIPGFAGLFVDASWYGKIVIETEGTADSLTDLQDRCGPGAFPSRVQSSARNMMSQKSLQREKDARKVFRVVRDRSHPGEIWIRAVSLKERRN